MANALVWLEIQPLPDWLGCGRLSGLLVPITEETVALCDGVKSQVGLRAGESDIE